MVLSSDCIEFVNFSASFKSQNRTVTNKDEFEYSVVACEVSFKFKTLFIVAVFIVLTAVFLILAV